MEYLNSIPFEFYITQFGVMFVLFILGGLLLRWPLHYHETGGFLIAGGIGSLVGFILATLPFLYVTAQHYLTKIFLGYHHTEWPPSWWPGWLPWFGPFDGFIVGSLVGFGVGSYVFLRRHRRSAV